jgi:hypothetical protein
MGRKSDYSLTIEARILEILHEDKPLTSDEIHAKLADVSLSMIAQRLCRMKNEVPPKLNVTKVLDSSSGKSYWRNLYTKTRGNGATQSSNPFEWRTFKQPSV